MEGDSDADGDGDEPEEPINPGYVEGDSDADGDGDEPDTPSPEIPFEPEPNVVPDFEMIPDDDVPLGDTPVEPDFDIGGVEIPDDDVPLAANPFTGVADNTAGLAMGAVGAAIALGLAAKKRGNKDDNK